MLQGGSPLDVFRAPLDAIEEALPEDLRKGGINQWLGSLMCAQYKYKVFTVETPSAEVPFTGARFTRAAPGGYDIFCQQRIATLASYRPLYQAVLDAELTLMAEVSMRLRNQFGAKPRQLRVDGCVVQVSNACWSGAKRSGHLGNGASASLNWKPTAAPLLT